jgi:hypothetical protein
MLTATAILIITIPIFTISAEESYTTSDALIILRAVSGLVTLTPEQEIKYDLNEDGNITTADALMILKKVAGIEESLTINNYGNTNGNLSNGGIATIQGDWIYYSNNGLYKININGTGKEKLSNDDCRSINVIGDYIYYVINGDLYSNSSNGIYRIHTDGTKRELLINETIISGNITVVDDLIYYGTYWTESQYMNEQLGWWNIPHGELYKIGINGTGKIKLKDDVPIASINVINDWIYYTIIRYEGNDLYKIRTDGTEETKIQNFDSPKLINVVGNWIYYSAGYDTSGVCKIRIDGTERTIFNGYSIYGLNVVDGWVYYSANDYVGDKGLYKMRIDGTEKLKLSDNYGRNINIISDWIYYNNDYSYNEPNKILYKIKTDGTGWQIVD